MLFRKKVKSLSVQDINSRVRGFVLDSQIENPHEIAVSLGCSRISDDVAEMEEEASDERIEQINYLSPLIVFFSKTLSEGIVETQRLENTSSEISPDMWLSTKRLLEHTATSALLGSLAQLIDLGLLEVPKGLRK
jgi:hypothetical protein